MAGKNQIFKENEVLFEEGDASNGMYILRSGKLKVFQRKEGKEITFAFLDPGAILGEMAFFENKPRSAAAKAVEQSECTVIDNNDFQKLLKQVPGWFVIMMRSLSSRLRITNEKLTLLAADNTIHSQKYPLHDVTRITTTLGLLFHRDAVKVGTTFQMNLAKFKIVMNDIYNDDYDRVHKILQIYQDFGFLSYGHDDYRNDVVIFANRPLFVNFVAFLQTYSQEKKNPDICLSEDTFALLELICTVSSEATYESMTLTLSFLEGEARERGIHPGKWAESVAQLVDNQIVKKVMDTASDIGLRCGQKDAEAALKYHKIIKAFVDADLA